MLSKKRTGTKATESSKALRKPLIWTAVAVAGVGVALGGTALAVTTAQATTAGTIPPCQSGQVQVSVIGEDAAMGHRQLNYRVENVSDSTCYLHDAPAQVSRTDGVETTTRVGDTYFTKNPPADGVILNPGEQALGEIAWSVSEGPAGNEFGLTVTFPDVGQVPVVGYVDTFGALNNEYVVTNVHS